MRLQTREALQHAQQAGCPIILALTKCDMPGADPERVKAQLLSAGLLLEEAGGNVMVGPALLPLLAFFGAALRTHLQYM